MSKLDSALALAAQGFKVFPIKPGNKAPPLLNGWPQRASCDPEEVRAYWLAVPDANIGIHCDGLLVLDIDPKNNGYNSLLELEVKYGELPRTYETATPSGGRHIYYRADGPVANNVALLGPGIDVRGRGGYVVAAGSTTDAGEYNVHQALDIAQAPQWLLDFVGKPNLGTKEPKTGTVPPAPDAAVDRARAWLATQAPAVEGQGGDAHTFAVACGLRDLGISQEQTVNLLSTEWNALCQPPWMPEELGVKVRNAYNYGQNEPGSKAALPTDFPIVQSIEQNSAVVAPLRQTAQRLSQFANSEARGPGYLVKGLLQRRTYAELFGQPGEGKTFVALDIAYCVAAGAPWMGRKTHAGPVLYLAYEGTGGLVKRAQALRQRYGEGDVPLYVASAAYNLREKAGRQDLGCIISALPEKPVLIVIDTFARALMGGDENSAQDVGAFNNAVAALIESTGACVLIIHHSGKNKSAGARGSSALQGAFDTEIECDGGRVTASKQRDIEAGEPIGFKLVPLIVGLDEDGDELTSCIVEASAIAGNGPSGRISGNTKRGFDVLCELSPGNELVSELRWRDECGRTFLGGKSVAARFFDIKKVLLQKRYIEVSETGMVTRRME